MDATTSTGTEHLTDTDRTILAAALTGTGDFYATRRALARFCTEALASCAAAVEIPVKFASEPVPTWRGLTRDEAMFRLCGWTSWRRVLKFGETLAAARAELPAALEALGAAL